MNTSVERSHAQEERATKCSDAGFQAIAVRRQMHCGKSPIGYCFKLHGKNAQTLMYPLYKNYPPKKRDVDRFARAHTQSINQGIEVELSCGVGCKGCFLCY